MRQFLKNRNPQSVAVSSVRQQSMMLTFSLLVLVICSNLSCKKYLDVKSDQQLSTLGTMKDMQLLLDNPGFYRRGIKITNTSSDEYYIPYNTWQRQREPDKSAYIWGADANVLQEWVNQYQNVFMANNVLDNWDKIVNGQESQQAKDIKGSALFHRAYCFYQIAQIYAPQFDASTAGSDLGIVLRLDADFNKKSQRSTVQQTYSQIINDLETAIGILSPNSAYNSRPNRAAALALLARTQLQIGNYEKARDAAIQSLQIYDYLIDYNDPSQVDTLLGEPFKNKNKNNKEILFLSNNDGSINAVNPDARIDSTLFNSYSVNDIRRSAFFKRNSDGTYMFRGSYNGSLTMGAFVGIGTAEVYLIKAEANARLGNKDEALQALNYLLARRYKSGTFAQIITTTAEEALDIIIAERKKELVYRGMRWADLKRLNKVAKYQQPLKRILNGQVYALPPNDNRYTFLIPREIIKESNIEQNNR